jgi:predicted nucleic acid-binding protein
VKRLFADTAYWIALTNSFDQYHATAVEVSSALGNCHIFTTEAVLTEFLNALADKGPHVRTAAVKMVEAIMRHSHSSKPAHIQPQSGVLQSQIR